MRPLSFLLLIRTSFQNFALSVSQAPARACVRLCDGLLALRLPSREERVWTAVGPEGKVTAEWTSGLWKAPLSVACTGFVVSQVPEEDPVKTVLSKVLSCTLGKSYFGFIVFV